MAAKHSGSAGDVWLRRPARAAREAPPLSRDRIVREAVALLDEEGAGRLTMRRLAERLGTGSTTLYWHVKTKDDVLDLALDAIFAAVEIPRPGAQDWRAGVTALISGWRAVLLEHPWSAALLGRPMLGPNVLARSEFLYATLVGAGVTEPHLTAAAYGLSNYVIGSALMQATWTAQEEDAPRQAAREFLRDNRDRYPVLATHGPLTGDSDWDTSFALGLAWLLDGIGSDEQRTERAP
ncbi:TetR/AcrR family transcriptional regulator C-terminal domain-containing protein [Microbispora sp. RL4-1S]|uniref:TetR/AcrR family transcriptional regulator C-terminal domain-containing protein n=1 Tax=Microbispora oryzae TaxID=2806554 RepID=A0A941AQ18_9ACTN|nr:TetR/AcrR family transcriptional regulator [Microbispora oryzae]MBP2704264.1 TetR/AcrR family transcriptional regulator C-terminal domain-containing protein [Microbispora oryzae]